MANIDRVDPNVLVQSGERTIRIFSSGTNFAEDTSVVSFIPPDDITVEETDYHSVEWIDADVLVDGAAADGYRDVVVTTGAEVVVLPSGIRIVTATTPRIVSVALLGENPGDYVEVLQGQTVTIDVVGANTYFINGISEAYINPSGGIAVNSTTVNNITHAIVDITVDKDCVIGFKDLNII